jgi:hypothetical protein
LSAVIGIDGESKGISKNYHMPKYLLFVVNGSNRPYFKIQQVNLDKMQEKETSAIWFPAGLDYVAQDAAIMVAALVLKDKELKTGVMKCIKGFPAMGIKLDMEKWPEDVLQELRKKVKKAKFKNTKILYDLKEYGLNSIFGKG